MTWESEIRNLLQQSRSEFDQYLAALDIVRASFRLQQAFYDYVIFPENTINEVEGLPPVLSTFSDLEARIVNDRGNSTTHVNVFVTNFVWRSTVRLTESNVTYHLSDSCVFRAQSADTVFFSTEAARRIIFRDGIFDLQGPTQGFDCPANSQNAVINATTFGGNFSSDRRWSVDDNIVS